MMKIKNNKDLLTLKVFGYSNLKIFFILALFSFILGWIILFAINPITASMSTFYEKTKSNYSRDIDHLVNFNKNGLWIKKLPEKKNNICRTSLMVIKFNKFKIFHYNQNSRIVEKILANKANIKKKYGIN